MGASVIGHGIVAGNHLAKCRDSLDSLSRMYEGNRQSPRSSRLASHRIQRWWMMSPITSVPTFLRRVIGTINSRKDAKRSKDIFQESVQSYEFGQIGIDDGSNSLRIVYVDPHTRSGSFREVSTGVKLTPPKMHLKHMRSHRILRDAHTPHWRLRPHLKSFEIVHNIHFQTFVSSLPLATAEALLKSTSPKTPF